MSHFDLTGRVAVITGGASGVGRVIALALQKAGASIVTGGRRAAPDNGAPNRTHLSLDVQDRSSVDRMRDLVLQQFGRVDIVVNCAGQIFRKPTVSIDEHSWNNLMDVNLTGTLRVCQSFFHPLAQSPHARIINIASLNSFVSFLEVSAYAASKAGVLGLTRSLAVEWAGQGIRVNSIAPGVFLTDLNRELLTGTDRGKELLMRTPMKRFGDLEELAGTAVYLASDAASFVTGQCIVVDGGFLASGVNS